MSEDLLTEIERVKNSAECLLDREQIEARITELAEALKRDLAGLNPIFITILNGGLIFSGKLIANLEFPLQMDYLHASRYRGETSGKELQWIATPTISLKNRHVVLVDDILDQGYTLKEIADSCRKQGAASLRSVVLIKKNIEASQSCGFVADYIGFEVEDKYVFGYGMDYKNYLRNAAGIFAVSEKE